MADLATLKEYEAGEFRCVRGQQGELGRGGSGVVRLAFHTILDTVAAKCFAVIGGEHDKDFIAREIKKELESLQRTNHDNILRVFGWVRWEGSMAMIMEFLPGGNLRRLLREHSVELTAVLRLSFCLDVASGVASIHNLCADKRLTHGDLKPDNILLTSRLRCKVADFGSSKLISYTGSTSTCSSGLEAQQLTLIYAAPERLEGRPVRPKKEQDTYSYGMIVHGVLSRETPHQYFAGERQYLDAIRSGERPDSEAIADFKDNLVADDEKQIVEALESVMSRCWAQEDTRRPNMLLIRDELKELFRKRSPAEISRDVATAIEGLRISHPSQMDHCCVPLNAFDTRLGRFCTAENFMHQQAPDSQRDSNVTSLASIATAPERSRSSWQQNSDEGESTVRQATVNSSVGANATEHDERQVPSSRFDSWQAATMSSHPVGADRGYTHERRRYVESPIAIPTDASAASDAEQTTASSMACPGFDRELSLDDDDMSENNLSVSTRVARTLSSDGQSLAAETNSVSHRGSSGYNNSTSDGLATITSPEDDSERDSPAIVVIGGKGSEQTCKVYDVNTGNQKSLPDVNIGRVDAVAAKVGRYILVAGGMSQGIAASAEVLNLDNATEWFQIKPMTQPRRRAACAVLNECVFVTGGESKDGRATSSCEKYDFQRQEWSVVGDMLHKRVCHGMVECAGSLWCLGGKSASFGPLSLMERYDLATDNWTQVANMAKARSSLGTATHNRSIYAIGGIGDQYDMLGTVERYDTETDAWTTLRPLTRVRWGHGAYVARGRLCVVGGWKEPATEEYDEVSDVWFVRSGNEISTPISAALVA